MATKTIELSYGRKALVNEQDYDEISKYKWFAYRRKGHWFAARWDYGTLIFMQDEIAKPAEGWVVRHAEQHRTLDNRRENLVHYKIETVEQRPQRPYRGVSEVKLVDGTSRYVARIKYEGKTITLGRFTDPVEAAKVYDLENYRLKGPQALEVANFKEELMASIERI